MSKRKLKGIVVGNVITVALWSVPLVRAVALLPGDNEPFPVPTPSLSPSPLVEAVQEIVESLQPSPSPSPSPSPTPNPVPSPSARPSPSVSPSLSANPSPSPSPVLTSRPRDGAGTSTIGSVVESVAEGPSLLGPNLSQTGAEASVRWDFGPNSFRAPGPRSTDDILDSLSSIAASPALVASILAPFPVAGEASYSDDWGLPRLHFGELELHEGTDIFANQGTPVIASSDGIVELTSGALLAGNQVKLIAADATYYIYAHLAFFAPQLSSRDAVDRGQVLGFVGDSGNAMGGLPHLHYEIHPQGGAAVPPVPYLDRWLMEARAKAEALKDGTQVSGGSLLVTKEGSGIARAAAESSQGPQAAADFRTSSFVRSPASTWVPVFVIGTLLMLRRRRRRAKANVSADNSY